MDEVWMFDYLNAVFPMWGVFESEQACYDWLDLCLPENPQYYKPFMLTVNRELKAQVPHTAPFTSYRNQR